MLIPKCIYPKGIFAKVSDLLSSTASKFISTQARPIFAKTTILSRPLFSGPKTVQASVTLLEQLPTFLEKSYR